MATVYFASAHVKRLSRDDTLPAKFERLLEKLDFPSRFKDQSVAIKMHLGGGIGYTTIHPLFVRQVVSAVKKAGGKPFVTDGPGALQNATPRGYTAEVLGAPIVLVAGAHDKYCREVKVGFKSLKTVQLGGNIVDAGGMVVLSHGKGHGHCGFGGAIKNLAMGCVTGKTRSDIHALMENQFEWDAEACELCKLCLENCPTGAIRFDKENRLSVFEHHCRYCMHCVETCPNNALKIDQSTYPDFQKGMALTTKAVLDTFKPGSVVFINVLLSITPLCDCWGFTTPAIVPDVGVLASEEVPAIEQASLDLIKVENYIPNSLPDQLPLDKHGHLFQRVHGKDPYIQVRAAAEAGLGLPEYELVEIE